MPPHRRNLSSVLGGLALAVAGLVFAAMVAAELRIGAAGGAMAEGATRAESPAAFWFIVAVQACTALALVAAGARAAGVPLPVAPRPLVITALALGVLLGGWMAVEFALKMLGLSRELSGDPATAIFVRVAAVAMLGVLAYLIWEFGISEIAERLRRRDEDEE
jgi:hypothetical protein